jgi:hypothetical protein
MFDDTGCYRMREKPAVEYREALEKGSANGGFSASVFS